ncbi:GNAT family N-acetyltransferase [Hymenobacter sp. BT175]|uniref:GNAT family N-acetyltransferase n=1 Tax=Hymenobacter translucens TaxID=2886507 RepID=UPI001D0DE28C|nr:GNAT family N-acetyltransferase [Hymenobacter translucens]MCC2548366.1 GNAT family N-acetyltransferase [Hymenobacter translucens]
MLSAGPIFLRALEPGDLDFLYVLENDPSLWAVSDTLAPLSRHVLTEYLSHAAADFYEVRQLRLVICQAEDGCAVGTIDLFGFEPRHQRAGVGITVVAGKRGRGVAREALTRVLDYARDTLYLHQLHCTIAVTNTASRRLFEGAGFRQVGVRRDWLRTKNGWEDVLELQCVFRDDTA